MIKEVSEEERKEVVALAGQVAEYYSKEPSKKKNIVADRRERMIEHLRNGEVLILEIGHVLFDQWVKKDIAEEDKLRYYSPDHYLQSAKDMGRVGTIERAF